MGARALISARWWGGAYKRPAQREFTFHGIRIVADERVPAGEIWCQDDPRLLSRFMQNLIRCALT